MFKNLLLLAGITIFCGCRDAGQTTAANTSVDTIVVHDTIIKTTTENSGSPATTTAPVPTAGGKDNVLRNDAFRNVTVQQIAEHQFTVAGEARVFEAAFSWVIEDGHNELQQGHETTSAGAPEWGHFKFTVEAPRQRPNSTLHLILYEASAKDGSRQHELAIPLP